MLRRVQMAAVIVVLTLILVYPLTLAVIAVRSPMPQDVGLETVLPCPHTPNCVSSADTRTDWYVAPLRYTGDAQIARIRLREVIEAQPRMFVLGDTGDYLLIERRTPIFRLVDDIELLFDDANGMIHIRSVARLDDNDRGRNRRTVERLRAAFEQTDAGTF